jgi:Flp pilus assembly protein TadG
VKANAAAHSRTIRSESAQAIVLVVLAMIPLLGMMGLIVDIGYAYYGQRS